MSITVLRTKLFIPQPRAVLVSRPRLTARLKTGALPRLTLISGPPGFGKTTLLSEWIPQNSYCVTWLSLDEGDNDPVRFWTYFISALQMLQPDLGSEAQALLAALQPPAVQSPLFEPVLTVLINEIAAFPDLFAHVFDDYHVIEDPAIHQGMQFLLEHQPANLHLVLASRVDPPWPLSRLRARGRLDEIRTEDLRFSLAESAAFLKQVLNVEMRPEEITALEQKTEGWIAGLQLAALSMKDRQDLPGFIAAFTGSHRYIFGYLVEETLSRQPAEIEEFLLKTAILDRLCGPLCDALMNDAERTLQQTLQQTLQDRPPPPPAVGPSVEILKYLDRSNLFISALDDEGRWFRYHPLFAEALRARLQAGRPGLLTELHRRASAWFEQHGEGEEALNHALAAADFDRAQKLIEGQAGPLVQGGELATLQGWLKSLPEEQVQASPVLSTYAGWLSLLAGKIHAAISYAESARAAANEALPAADRGRLLSLLAQLAVAQEEDEEAIRFAGEALPLIGAADETFRTLSVASLARAYQQLGDIAGAVGALRPALQRKPALDCQPISASISANLVVLLNQQGRLREAESVCRQSLDGLLQSCSGPPPAAGMLYAALAQVQYEQNDLDAARQAVSRGLELNRQLGLVRLNLSAWHVLALLDQAQGDREAALTLLESARQTAAAARLSRFASLFAAQAAEVHLFNGDLHAVEAWQADTGLPAEGPLNQALDLQSLTLARLLLAQKRPVEARALLTRLDESMQKGERNRARMTARILQARVHEALGHIDRAARDMALALEMAAPEGYLSVFLHEGVQILPILTRSRPAAPDFVDMLLAAFKADPRHSPDSPSTGRSQLPLVESLNERELQVLRLIAQGLSNREIADQLVLALSTVKSHINNVYGKLGARSRTQAIALARALGLLDG